MNLMSFFTWKAMVIPASIACSLGSFFREGIILVPAAFMRIKGNLNNSFQYILLRILSNLSLCLIF